MNALLICPATPPVVANLAEFQPLAAAPILGECLATDWIEYLAARGAKRIMIACEERKEMLSAAVGDGRRWGVEIEWGPALSGTDAERIAEIRASGGQGWMPPPDDVVVMDHLPGLPDHRLLESYGAWFAGIFAWMPKALTPSRVRIKEARPGVWIGAGAHVAKSAEICAPCWIGEHAMVEADAVFGPQAVVENRSVIGRGAHVSESIVGPDTLVGPLTSVHASLADGNLLTNWKTGSSLRVPDPFLLSSLVQAPSAPRAPRTSPQADRRQPIPMKIEGRGSALRVSHILSLTEENSSEFIHTIRSALSNGHEPVEIDLSQTSEIDSGGLGALFTLSSELDDHRHAPLRLINPTPQIQQLFELTQLNLFFGIRRST